MNQIRHILGFLLTGLAVNAGGQALYVLNLNDASTYSVTCGMVTASQWSIKNAYCSLISSEVRYPGNPGDSAKTAPVSITFASTGNVDCSEVFPDGAFVRYSVNGGSWRTLSNVTGCQFQNNSSYTLTYNLFAPAAASVRLMVSIVTTSKTEKIWIKNGDIMIGAAVTANASTWVKKRGDESPEPDDEKSAKEVSMRVFPNPAAGSNITVSVNGLGADETLIVLQDMLGRQIYAKTLVTDNGKVIATFPAKGLTKGIYIITASSNNKLYQRKLIVK